MTKPKNKTGTTVSKNNKQIIRGAYDRKRVTIKFESYTRTKQSFKNDCDVNNIVRQHTRNKIPFHLPQAENFGFHTGLDFRESVELVMQAQTMFDELPSHVRTQFQNNPGAFLDFVQDPDNADELVTMGLALQKSDGSTDGALKPSEDPPKPSADPPPDGKSE